jgi:TolB-like protein/Flp pilus assembly protein TadD
MDELCESSLLRTIYRAIERRQIRALAARGADRVTKVSPVRFGCFELDATNLVLRKRGKPVKIHLTPLRLLNHLVQNAERTVSKEELLETVWSDAAVSDCAISSALKELRHVLGDDGARQRLIQTQRGLGYRFIGMPVEPGGDQSLFTIAVLPFECLPGGRDCDGLAAGMTDALIDEMSGVPGLRVIARTSVMRCGVLRESISEIAATLGAEAIVTGTVARERGNVRISFQLLEGRTENLIWSDHYDRELGNQLELESELAGAIVQRVRTEISAGGPTRTPRSSAADLEAEKAVLRGQYQFRLYNPTSLQRACDAFEKAVVLSPDYAEAHAHLAICYRALWADMHALDRAVAMSKARAAAIRGLHLAPTLGKCHAAHGVILASFDWDWKTAASEFRKAVALSPRDPVCLMSQAKLTSAMGDPLRAVDRGRRAVEADPLNLPLRLDFARLLWWARRYEEALAEQFVVVDMDPDLAIAYADLGASCHHLGRFDEAVAAWGRAVDLQGFSDEAWGRVARAYERGGIDSFWRVWIETAEPVAKAWRIPASWLWVAYAAIGELDRAFEWLERDFERRAEEFVSARVSPFFDPIRADPRFREMLDRLGLPGS